MFAAVALLSLNSIQSFADHDITTVGSSCSALNENDSNVQKNSAMTNTYQTGRVVTCPMTPTQTAAETFYPELKMRRTSTSTTTCVAGTVDQYGYGYSSRTVNTTATGSVTLNFGALTKPAHGSGYVRCTTMYNDAFASVKY
jgi:hypothetical protein